eukprot:609098-Prorocentrum_lima.AAC.1
MDKRQESKPDLEKKGIIHQRGGGCMAACATLGRGGHGKDEGSDAYRPSKDEAKQVTRKQHTTQTANLHKA